MQSEETMKVVGLILTFIVPVLSALISVVWTMLNGKINANRASLESQITERSAEILLQRSNIAKIFDTISTNEKENRSKYEDLLKVVYEEKGYVRGCAESRAK